MQTHLLVVNNWRIELCHMRETRSDFRLKILLNKSQMIFGLVFFINFAHGIINPMILCVCARARVRVWSRASVCVGSRNKSTLTSSDNVGLHDMEFLTREC